MLHSRTCDGHFVITGSDRRVVLHRIQDGSLHDSFPEEDHLAGINQVGWLTDDLIVTAADDGLVRIKSLSEVRRFLLFMSAIMERVIMGRRSYLEQTRPSISATKSINTILLHSPPSYKHHHCWRCDGGGDIIPFA